MFENKKKLLGFIKDIDPMCLYWEEFYISEKLIDFSKYSISNWYMYDYHQIWSLIFGRENWDNFETASLLYILQNIWLIDRGTSIRYGWVEHESIIDNMDKCVYEDDDSVKYSLAYLLCYGDDLLPNVPDEMKIETLNTTYFW